jgi:Integrase core domain.
MSDVFKKICKLFKITKLKTTAYHPESNGALERSHKTLLTYLRCYVDL